MEQDEILNSDTTNSTNSSQSNQFEAADNSTVNQSADVQVISENQLSKAATSEQHSEEQLPLEALIISPYSDTPTESAANSRGNENRWGISEEIPTEVLIRKGIEFLCIEGKLERELIRSLKDRRVN